MKIRSKLGLALALTALLPITILSVVAASVVLDRSELDFGRHAQQKMRIADGHYRTFIAGIRADVEYLASSPGYSHLGRDLPRFLGTRVDGPHTAAGQREYREFIARFRRFIENKPALHAVYFGSTDGAMIRAVDNPLVGYDPRTRPWYRAAVAQPGETIVTEPYWGVVGVPMVSASRAVYREDGSLAGVQGVDVTLEMLTSIVSDVRLGKSGYMMLVAADGTVMADPVNDSYLFRRIDEIEHPVYRHLAESGVSTQADPRRVGDYIVSSYRSPDYSWQFLTIMDYDEFMAPQYDIMVSGAIVAAVTVTLFSLLGLLLARRITAPINHVSASLGAIATGGADLNNPLKVTGSDEISMLAQRFNEFLDSARHRQAEQLRDQKLEAVGQLSAGIAHEINTPAQFVGDNVSFMNIAATDLFRLMDDYCELLGEIEAGTFTGERLGELRERIDEADLAYLREDIPDAIAQAREGVERINTIVRAMKSFTHSGSGDWEWSNLNDAVTSTLTIARNEWKFCASVETGLDPDLPAVECIPGEINQAILNIVVNAAQAIDARRTASGDSAPGIIKVTSQRVDDFAELRISDNGTGIDAECCKRIFDPFFTTKEVGQGTGQGLAIAFQTVVERHGGKLDVESEPGHGTTFILRLPLQRASANAPAGRAVA